jgi:hypothetical protein
VLHFRPREASPCISSSAPRRVSQCTNRVGSEGPAGMKAGRCTAEGCSGRMGCRFGDCKAVMCIGGNRAAAAAAAGIAVDGLVVVDSHSVVAGTADGLVTAGSRLVAVETAGGLVTAGSRSAVVETAGGLVAAGSRSVAAGDRPVGAIQEGQADGLLRAGRWR